MTTPEAPTAAMRDARVRGLQYLRRLQGPTGWAAAEPIHAVTVIDAADGGFCPYCLHCGPLAESEPFQVAHLRAKVHTEHHHG